MNAARACRNLRGILATNHGTVPDPAVAAWLADAVRKWARLQAAPEQLVAFLGLPGTHAGIAREERNYWLRIAARYVPGQSKKQRAEHLAKRIQRFAIQGMPARPDICDQALQRAFAQQVTTLQPRQLEDILGAVD